MNRSSARPEQLRRTNVVLAITFCSFWASFGSGGDWPQLLGPERNGIAAADERLADAWPVTGPRELWQRPVGSGYAGPAVAGNRLILFHREGNSEITEALDPETGKTLWRVDHATRFQPQVGGGDGPLCTPTIADGRVITFGAQGMLTCAELATGQIHWQRDTHREFSAPEGYFGSGSSPLVVGDCVVVNVGGRDGAGVVGFDLASGTVRWQATNEPASYAAPTAARIGDRSHAVVITRYQCLLIDPADGSISWQFPFGMRGPTVNAATPLTWANADGSSQLFVTASYGIGSVCAQIDDHAATPIWEGDDSLASQYCTPILLDGNLYCIDGRDDVPPATLKSVEAATGKVCWQQENFGYGTLLAVDGKLLAAKTDGELLLLRPSPAGVETLARARPLPGTLRALPALAAGRLYLRDDTTLTCLDVRR